MRNVLVVVALGSLAGLLLLTSAALTSWWTEDQGQNTLNGITVTLHSQDSSGASGWATLMPAGDHQGDTRVVLSLASDDMTVTDSMRAHIHTGVCDTPGGVAHSLNNLAEDKSTTVIQGVSLDSFLTGNFAIDTHGSSNAGRTTCGNIPDAESIPLVTNQDTPSVSLTNFRFFPSTLDVESGKTAQFRVISSGVAHTFTIPSLGVDIVMPAGAEHTIDIEIPENASGELKLICRFHEGIGMIGKLLVTESDDSLTPTPTKPVRRSPGPGGGY